MIVLLINHLFLIYLIYDVNMHVVMKDNQVLTLIKISLIINLNDHLYVILILIMILLLENHILFLFNISYFIYI